MHRPGGDQPGSCLAEQVVEGQTGVIASEVGVQAFADAVRRLATSPRLYAEISRFLHATAPATLSHGCALAAKNGLPSAERGGGE